MAGEQRGERPNLGQAAATLTAMCSSSSFVTLAAQIARAGRYVEGRDGGGSFVLLAACAADQEHQGATGGHS